MIGWSEIIQKAKLLIDDVRWDRELALSPARFFRAKSDWVLLALPLLNRPPNLTDWLKSGMVAPSYDDAEWVSTAESLEGPVTVKTGMAGYDLCSVTVLSGTGNPSPTGNGGTGNPSPTEEAYTDFTYDKKTGAVTFAQQAAEDVVYELDFYTDGSFRDFDESIMRLFALAVAVVWDERFDNNWLNIQMKIHDSSFSTANEGNYAEKISQRRERNRAAFTEELKQYEQNRAYLTRVPRARYFGI